MKRLVLLSAAALCLASCQDSATEATNWNLVWEDNFDGASGALASATNWSYDVGTDWGNAQQEYDTDRASNASLDGTGNLVITARREAYKGSAYTSARLITRGLREFTYGKFEARMKLPSGRGMWPAFWLLGANKATVGWPQTGEIDIMEYRGQEPGTAVGSMHGPGYSGGAAITKRYSPTATRFDNSFHVFTVEWSPEQVDYLVDGKPYQTIKKSQVPGEWVFNHPFYIILNVAVGGNFVGAPDGVTPFPTAMTVDWVRVYQLKP
jgi:beta-glucanase (GH16 family)